MSSSTPCATSETSDKVHSVPLRRGETPEFFTCETISSRSQRRRTRKRIRRTPPEATTHPRCRSHEWLHLHRVRNQPHLDVGRDAERYADGMRERCVAEVPHGEFVDADRDAAHDEPSAPVGLDRLGTSGERHRGGRHRVFRSGVSYLADESPGPPGRDEESEFDLARNAGLQGDNGLPAGSIGELRPQRSLPGLPRRAEKQAAIGLSDLAYGPPRRLRLRPAQQDRCIGNRDRPGLVSNRDPQGGPAVAVVLLLGLPADRTRSESQYEESRPRPASSVVHGNPPVGQARSSRPQSSACRFMRTTGRRRSPRRRHIAAILVRSGGRRTGDLRSASR